MRARKTGTSFGTDHFSRDAAGRIVSVAVGQGAMGSYTARSWYGPLGAVVAADNVTWNPEADVTGGIEEFETDALGNRTWQRQRNLYPGGPDRNGIRAMTYSQGRLTSLSAIPSDTLYPNFGYEQQIDHDNAGNTTLSHTQRSEGTGGTEQVFLSSRSYYDAAGRLVVVNTHDGVSANTGPGGVWEEYRYDALGRRVLVRSRRLAGTVPQPGGAGNPWSYTERTLWDGDRIVAELRGDGSGGATVGDIESPGTGGIVQNGDAPWGSVQYIHALGSAASGGIDMPVQIERDAVYSGSAIRFTPLTNWRGQVQGAAAAPGSGDVPSIWPAARLTLDGLPAETDPNYFWMGSLANGMTDGSGLQYRRNRYYDPETGRFTQSDPIGLAGGLNLYGFAGGDPLNYTDPFGLCGFAGAGWSILQGAGTAAATGSDYGIGQLATDAVLGAVCIGAIAKLGKVGRFAARFGDDAADTGDAIRRSGRATSIPGRPFRGANAPERAYEHLERHHGLDPNVARVRLHRLKQQGGLRGDDDVVIGRTGDVYHARSGERLGTLTDRSLGGS